LLKFAKAAQLSFTKGALQQNHIKHLLAVNNEAKTRRATKSEILEKSSRKVFTYKHLQEVRLKRAEMVAAKEAKAKGKRGRKSKKATQEAVEATTTSSTVRPSRKRKSTAIGVEANSLDVGTRSSMPKSKVARVSNVEAAEATGVLWAALVANMY
jgi:hypothetical protein